MAATKSPGRDGDEPQPRSAPILHTTSPLESGEILCRCKWVYWISNFCCGLGWLGRMEIGNPSMIKLTFEVWHLKQVWQGESDIDAIFVLMVWWCLVSAASVTCVEVSISAAGGDGQYRHYRHRFRGYQDSWPGRTRLDQDQGTQGRGQCWIRSIRFEEPHDQLVLSHHTGSVHCPCLACASKGVSSVQRSDGQMFRCPEV